MQKFLISFTSANPITGPILVTTSPRATCPNSCPLRRAHGRDGVHCYAEHGYLGGFLWRGLDETPPGRTFGNGIRIFDLAQLITVIRCLEAGSVWRHNQAGDLYAAADGTIDCCVLEQLIEANRGRRGFCFTHHDVVNNSANRDAVRAANAAGFRINLSADDLAHADRLVALGIAPVAVIIAPEQRTNLWTPEGRRVVVCPARTRKGVTCATCQLCTRERPVIVGLPALTGTDNNIYQK